MDPDRQAELARLLAGLRRERRTQSGLDAALVPPDKRTAYRIAERVAELLERPVVGWKIAANMPHMQQALRTDAPIYGRVFAPELHATPVEVDFASCCSPIPESEYMARLGQDLPPRRTPYKLDEVSEAVASLHPGLELAECRFIHDQHFPPLTAILADGAGAGGLVYGPAIENWRDQDIRGQQVTLRCNDRVRRTGTAASEIDHPLVSLTWLANELSSTGIGLHAEQMISTGTLTGMLRPHAGETWVADFGPFGQVRARYR